MTQEQLSLYKSEYRLSLDKKTDKLHKTWQSLLGEYRMNNYWHVWEYLTEQIELSPESYAATDGRVGHLNVTIRKFVSMINMANPDFLMENENPGDEPIAWLLENSFNRLQRDIQLSKTMRNVVFNAAVYGTGIIKVGYASELVYDEESWSGNPPQGIELGNEGLWPYGDTTEYHRGSNHIGRPMAISVKPTDIFFDAGARSMKEARRIYHRTSRRVVDIWHDERYDATARRQIKGTISPDYSESTYVTNKNNQDFLQEAYVADVVEIFDTASRMYCVISEEADTPLIDWTPFLLPIENPYHFYQPIPDPESPWGIPYALLIFQQARALSQLRAKTVDAIGRDGKKIILANENIFDEEDIADINQMRDMQWKTVSVDVDQDLSKLFTVIDFGGPTEGILQLQGLFENDLATMSGLDDPSRNAFRAGADLTATEINARQQQQGLSIADMRDVYEEFIEEVAADVCLIMLGKWDDQKLVQYVDDDPRIYFWVPVERERLMGQFNIRINVGSTEKMNKETYRRQLIDLIPRILEMAAQIDQEQMMVAMGQAQPSQVNRAELLREMLNAFDPRLANKVLRRKSALEVVQRLLEQGVVPESISPQLMQQLQAAQSPMQGQGVMGMPENVASFEEAQGIPAPAQGNQFGAGFQQDSPAGIGGRMMSEGAMN